MMRTVGLKTLKNKLSEYIRAAAAGETVLVTDRNRVIAEIVPAGYSATMSADQGMASLVQQGLVTPAKIPAGAPMPPRAPLMTFDELMRDLDESRSDR
jgi:prevent-host-death family protein